MVYPDYAVNLAVLNDTCRDTFGSTVEAVLTRRASGETLNLTLVNLPVVEPEESRNYAHLWVVLADCQGIEPAQGDSIAFEGRSYRIHQVRPEAGGGGALLRVTQTA